MGLASCQLLYPASIIYIYFKDSNQRSRPGGIMGLGDPAQAGCSTPRQLFIFILKIRTNDPAQAGCSTPRQLF